MLFLRSCAAALIATCSMGAFAEDMFESEPILYSASEPSNKVSTLKRELEAGALSLARDEKFGYLPSLLEHLKVPWESQALVFSKTSLQREYISPTNPRALYFNDEIYVGTVPGSGVIEISVADPKLGAVFYTLVEKHGQPAEFARQTNSCLQCHSGSMTNNIPGHMVRSVFADAEGFPILKAGTKVTTHESPFDERWGGWYVTGSHGDARHMGNALAVESVTGATLDRESGANMTGLPERVNPEKYLTGHSDIVALMVLEHQVQAHNLIAAAGYDTRMALHDQAVMDEVLQRQGGGLSDSTRRRIANAGDKLVRYLLFEEEAMLEAPVGGTSGFAEYFAQHGPRDRMGRALRDFDLQRRLFKYPLSYLIYSEAFDALPQEMKAYVYGRLWELLTTPDANAWLSDEQRRAIVEILAETKTDLPNYWKAKG